MDAKGWYWHEKLRIRLGWWAFLALEAVAHMCRAVTFGRVSLFHGRGHTWSRVGWVWIDLASAGYLIDDLKRGDMPEHERIGGGWR